MDNCVNGSTVQGVLVNYVGRLDGGRMNSILVRIKLLQKLQVDICTVYNWIC